MASSSLPGRTRPGLIEAPGHGLRWHRVAALFRGVRAPASLKRELTGERTAPDAPDLFRGVRAPASLKRSSRLPGRGRRTSLPGRTRPGLIEAKRRLTQPEGKQ